MVRLAAAQQPLLIALPLLVALDGPLVVMLLALGETDLELDASGLEMQIERDQRVTALFDLADQLVDFLRVQEEFACPHRIRVDVRGSGWQRTDVRADQPKRSVPDDNIALGDLPATGANRFHFPALENKPSLKSLLDKVIVKRLAVLDNGHGWSARVISAAGIVAA